MFFIEFTEYLHTFVFMAVIFNAIIFLQKIGAGAQYSQSDHQESNDIDYRLVIVFQQDCLVILRRPETIKFTEFPIFRKYLT